MTICTCKFPEPCEHSIPLQPIPPAADGYLNSRAFADCAQERLRQDNKWGEQDHDPMEWLSILGEEVGEVCKEANENKWNKKRLDDYRKELIEVAAVALAAVENLDRRRAGIVPPGWDAPPHWPDDGIRP